MDQQYRYAIREFEPVGGRKECDWMGEKHLLKFLAGLSVYLCYSQMRNRFLMTDRHLAHTIARAANAGGEKMFVVVRVPR